jgi:hypothetical protein
MLDMVPMWVAFFEDTKKPNQQGVIYTFVPKYNNKKLCNGYKRMPFFSNMVSLKH